MSSQEYTQLRAFARVDGALMSLLWIASFACFVRGIGSVMAMLCGAGLGLYSLVFAVVRLRRYRDVVREGSISFMRSYGYVMMMFFYSAILFAIAQTAYFSWFDGGQLVADISAILGSEENRRLIAESGLKKTMEDSLSQIAAISPIEYALNYLTTNIMAGAFIALPIAAVCRRAAASTETNRQ